MDPINYGSALSVYLVQSGLCILYIFIPFSGNLVVIGNFRWIQIAWLMVIQTLDLFNKFSLQWENLE